MVAERLQRFRFQGKRLSRVPTGLESHRFGFGAEGAGQVTVVTFQGSPIFHDVTLWQGQSAYPHLPSDNRSCSTLSSVSNY